MKISYTLGGALRTEEVAFVSGFLLAYERRKNCYKNGLAPSPVMLSFCTAQGKTYVLLGYSEQGTGMPEPDDANAETYFFVDGLLILVNSAEGQPCGTYGFTSLEEWVSSGVFEKMGAYRGDINTRGGLVIGGEETHLSKEHDLGEWHIKEDHKSVLVMAD